LAAAKFVDILSSKYEKVHGLLRCRHNVVAAQVPKLYDTDLDRAVSWYKSYKFAIVFEIMDKRGYISEKLVDAVLANTLPVYWGPPDIMELINMDAIVYCEPEEDDSFKTCIEEIKLLDQDDEQYMERLSQPLFKDNKLPKWMQWENLAGRVIDVYNKNVARTDR
jgi:alpha(1,3/1,4) fucosyltransferase